MIKGKWFRSSDRWFAYIISEDNIFSKTLFFNNIEKQMFVKEENSITFTFGNAWEDIDQPPEHIQKLFNEGRWLLL